MLDAVNKYAGPSLRVQLLGSATAVSEPLVIPALNFNLTIEAKSTGDALDDNQDPLMQTSILTCSKDLKDAAIKIR